MSDAFHSRTALPSISWTAGAAIFPELIQNWRVARDIFAARAACPVVHGFMVRTIAKYWTSVKYFSIIANMGQSNTILDSWLVEQNARINQLSTGSLGFSSSKLRPDWLAA